MVERSGTEVVDSELLSKQKFCYHCNDYVPKTTFYCCREQYFDAITHVGTLSGESKNSTLGSEMIENMVVSLTVSYDCSMIESADESLAFFDTEVSTRTTDIDHSIYLPEELSHSPLNYKEVTTIEARPEGTFTSINSSILIIQYKLCLYFTQQARKLLWSMI